MWPEILNGTSAQLGCTVPFTGQKTNQKQTLQKLNTTQKSKQHKTQQNKTSLVQSRITTFGQETGWAYSTMLPSPHGATMLLSESSCGNIQSYL